ncbi:Multiple inositol polyphosphate phosphatase [Phaffia rhodozyma]|uniref:Multiple inositol polyphosphate phosphatase n=1 Tax=Phaffia rhodozyma TaxID=264483 RepID=A0A0F7SN81_PHARH|nr:Multiple inositol polyphosphate phosphatase [Phaffia rhodozyma]
MSSCIVLLAVLSSFSSFALGGPTPNLRGLPIARRPEISTFFHNTQNASDPEFYPLHHLAGIAPYFISPGVELNPSPPEGCMIESASYLFRHTDIYANDYDYEYYLEPFLSKLLNFTARADFANTSLSLLSDYVPLLNITNATSQVSEVTPIGLSDAADLGRMFSSYIPHLVPTDNLTAFKVWTASADRDEDTTRAFISGFVNDTSLIEVVTVAEGELQAAQTLTPHDSCETYDATSETNESTTWLNKYASPIVQRLNAEIPAFNFTVDDVYAMQQLCGYDTVIGNDTSPFCTTDAFTNEDWLGFEYANDLKYHYSLGYGYPESPSLGLPWVLASVDQLLNITLSSPLAPSNTSTTNTTIDIASQQKLFLSFTHREEPAFLATALGIFNNSVGIAGNLTIAGDINNTMSTESIDRDRAWKTSEILPFLGNVGLEFLSCPLNGTSYIRVRVNQAPIPIPDCQSGPGSTCPTDEFITYIQGRKDQYGDFVKACALEDQKNATSALGIFIGDVI